MRRKARVQEKLEKLSVAGLHPRHHLRRGGGAGDGRRPTPSRSRTCSSPTWSSARAGRWSSCWPSGTWSRSPQARLKELIEEAERAAAAAARARRWWRCRPRPGRGLDRLMPAVFKAHTRLVDQGEDPRPQRLAAHGRPAPPAARGAAASGSSPSTWPRPRRGRRPSCCSPRRAEPAARQLSPLPDQLDPRELRPARRADPADREVGLEPLCRARRREGPRAAHRAARG